MFIKQSIIRNKIRQNAVLGLILLTATIPILACDPKLGKQQVDGFGVIEPALGDKVAARVNDTLITLMDIEREAAAQGLIQSGDPIAPGSDTFVQILDELIDQRLLAQEAVKQKLDRDLEAQVRLRIARERILGNVLVENAVAAAVTEKAVKRLYDEQAKLAEPVEEMRARHILVETRKQAEEIKAALGSGAVFASLAFERSKDATSRLEGGDLGFFSKSSMTEPFAIAAFALKVGEISEPIETKYGWHIIEAKDRRHTKTPDLETMRPRIVRFMTFDEIQKLVSDLRETAKIKREYRPILETPLPSGADQLSVPAKAQDQ